MSEREDELCELAARVHAATARLVQMAADLDTSGSWQGTGIRSAAHWLALHTGVAVYTGAEMVRVGHALRGLPLIRTAFSAGRLSFDKVRAATTVATADDEAIWLDVALSATSGQLGRICKGFIRATGADEAEKRQEQQRQRQVKSWWREDGMLELIATLPPEEGQLVRAAIENAACLRDTRGNGEAPKATDAAHADLESTPVIDADPGAINPHGARRADALVRICEQWLAEAGAKANTKARRQLVVHIDAETMIGTANEGRCQLDEGPGVSPDVARRLGCTADIVAVIERDGQILDFGRTRRLETPRMRRAREIRDGTCRYPGCAVPAVDSEGHHIRWWVLGGPTRLKNDVSLCLFHHHRAHDGEFTIEVGADGSFTFLTRGGVPILRPPHAGVDPSSGGEHRLRALHRAAGMQIDARTPTTLDYQSADLGYAISVIAENLERQKPRAP
ncbi:MAG TPA: DUF222 domain-containing protein [Candidatus Dormibacteraeota bacterium]|nr:DUF222 domain-containing protein [Candidatus Dormibacteraeota bacterium]